MIERPIGDIVPGFKALDSKETRQRRFLASIRNALIGAVGAVGLVGSLGVMHTNFSESLHLLKGYIFHTNGTSGNTAGKSDKMNSVTNRISNRIETFVKYPSSNWSTREKGRFLHQTSLTDINALIKKLSREHFLGDLVFISRANKPFTRIGKQDLTKQEWLVWYAKRFKYHNLGREEAGLLVKLIPGLPAQEGRLDNRAYHRKSGALGTFQITEIAMKDILKRVNFASEMQNVLDTDRDYRYDYKKAAHLALIHLDRNLYPVIKRPVEKLARLLNMTDKDTKQFMVLTLVNAYNAGAGTLRVSLNGFISEIQRIKEKASKAGERSRASRLYKYLSTAPALELFALFTDQAKQKKWHKLYGKDASNYTMLVIAATEASATINAVSLERDSLKMSNQINGANIARLIAEIDNNGYWWRPTAQILTQIN